MRDDEWPALRAAINQVFRPQGGDLTAECPLLFDPGNRARLRVIGGTSSSADARAGLSRVLAHVGTVAREAVVLKRRIRVVCIGAVFTVPDARGLGLAARLLADVLAHARPEADLVMASGDGGLYRRQGLAPIPPLARFHVPESSGRLPADVEIREATPGDLEPMASLYEAEDVHFVRSLADWSRLWGAGRLVDAPATFSVIAHSGRVVAYVAAQRAGRRPDGSARPRRILEIAGDRGTILDAASRLGEELLVPAYDTSTTSMCERTGWNRTARQFLITAEALTPRVLVMPWYGLNYV